MVALKCKKCGSYDISATGEGFICDECKAFYPADLMSELIEKEHEISEDEPEITDAEQNNQVSHAIELSQPLTVNGDTLNHNTKGVEKKSVKQKVKLAIVAVLTVVCLSVFVWLFVYPAICSARAERYLEAGDYEKAYEYYRKADNEEGMIDSCYQWAVLAENFEEADYCTAVLSLTEDIRKDVFSRLAESYVADEKFEDAYKCYEKTNDESSMIKVCYQWAEQCLDKGEKAQAAVLFGKAIGYLDAKERSFELWKDIAVRNRAMVSEMYFSYFDIGFTAFIFEDNEVWAIGDEYGEGVHVECLDNSVSIAEGIGEVVGLMADGTIASASGRYNDEENVVGIYDRISNNLGMPMCILYADGTACVPIGHFLCSSSQNENLIAVSSEIALKADGTVVASKDFAPYVESWTDIVDITSTTDKVYGLKSDGTVLSADKQGNRDEKVSGWRNIKDIAYGAFELIGLKADGTLVSTDVESSYADYTGVKELYETSYEVVCYPF